MAFFNKDSQADVQRLWYEEKSQKKDTDRWLQIKALSKDEFFVIKELGKGFYGQVQLVKNRTTGHLYAMKSVIREHKYETEEIVRHLNNERTLLNEVNSVWVMKMFHSFQDSHYHFLLLEYLPGGSLKDLLDQEGALLEYQVKFYGVEMLMAINVIHRCGFMHRNIQPCNFLFDSHGHLKLVDFGHSVRFLPITICQKLAFEASIKDGIPFISDERRKRTQLYQRKSTDREVGSVFFMSPEVVRPRPKGILAAISDPPDGTTYSFALDFWSLGVVLYNLLFGLLPFTGITVHEVSQKIMFWRKHLTFPIVQPVSDEAKDLIKRLLCDEPSRLGLYGCEDVMSHVFFEGTQWRNLRKGSIPIPYKIEENEDIFTGPPPKLIMDMLRGGNTDWLPKAQRQSSVKGSVRSHGMPTFQFNDHPGLSDTSLIKGSYGSVGTGKNVKTRVSASGHKNANIASLKKAVNVFQTFRPGRSFKNRLSKDSSLADSTISMKSFHVALRNAGNNNLVTSFNNSVDSKDGSFVNSNNTAHALRNADNNNPVTSFNNTSVDSKDGSFVNSNNTAHALRNAGNNNPVAPSKSGFRGGRSHDSNNIVDSPTSRNDIASVTISNTAESKKRNFLLSKFFGKSKAPKAIPPVLKPSDYRASHITTHGDGQVTDKDCTSGEVAGKRYLKSNTPNNEIRTIDELAGKRGYLESRTTDGEIQTAAGGFSEPGREVRHTEQARNREKRNKLAGAPKDPARNCEESSEVLGGVPNDTTPSCRVGWVRVLPPVTLPHQNGQRPHQNGQRPHQNGQSPHQEEPAALSQAANWSSHNKQPADSSNHYDTNFGDPGTSFDVDNLAGPLTSHGNGNNGNDTMQFSTSSFVDSVSAQRSPQCSTPRPEMSPSVFENSQDLEELYHMTHGQAAHMSLMNVSRGPSNVCLGQDSDISHIQDWINNIPVQDMTQPNESMEELEETVLRQLSARQLKRLSKEKEQREGHQDDSKWKSCAVM